MNASENRDRRPRAPTTRADLEHWPLAEELLGLCRRVEELQHAVRNYIPGDKRAVQSVRDCGWALDSLCTVEVDGPFETGKAALLNAMLNWRLALEAPRLDVFISHRDDAHAPLYFKVTCEQATHIVSVGWGGRGGANQRVRSCRRRTPAGRSRSTNRTGCGCTGTPRSPCTTLHAGC